MISQVKTCPKCSQKVPQGVAVCNWCGYAFGNAARPYSTPGMQIIPQPEPTILGISHATFGLVLGLVGFVLVGCFPVSVPCGIAAIVFGRKSLKRDPTDRNEAMGGIILGIFGLVATVAVCGYVVATHKW